ncbi:hypothetical protein [Nonomuraea fuscirosea]|uniref:hypothetical protein n=1 Tax=Nonomuraea fuscirosea TaxID=1291556 RepID=UPI0033E6E3EB
MTVVCLSGPRAVTPPERANATRPAARHRPGEKPAPSGCGKYVRAVAEELGHRPG